MHLVKTYEKEYLITDAHQKEFNISAERIKVLSKEEILANLVYYYQYKEDNIWREERRVDFSPSTYRIVGTEVDILTKDPLTKEEKKQLEQECESYRKKEKEEAIAEDIAASKILKEKQDEEEKIVAAWFEYMTQNLEMD